MKSTADLAEFSILRNFEHAELHDDPYPYLVIPRALPQGIYDELEATFPEPELVIDGREVKDTWYDYPACRVVDNQQFAGCWRDFFRYHTSGDFFRELTAKLGSRLRQIHPDLAARTNKDLEDYVVKMRPGGREDPFADEADISMECQFYVNLTTQPRAVRGPHVDRPTELFAALLYFRHDDDDSEGGDLDVNASCNPATHPSDRSVRIDELPMEIADKHVTVADTVKYEPNNLVLFLNSARSIHAVTPRSPTPIPRRHINFCGDIRHDLFTLDLPARLRWKRTLGRMPVAWRLADKL